MFRKVVEPLHRPMPLQYPPLNFINKGYTKSGYKIVENSKGGTATKAVQEEHHQGIADRALDNGAGHMEMLVSAIELMENGSINANITDKDISKGKDKNAEKDKAYYQGDLAKSRARPDECYTPTNGTSNNGKEEKGTDPKACMMNAITYNGHPRGSSIIAAWEYIKAASELLSEHSNRAPQCKDDQQTILEHAQLLGCLGKELLKCQQKNDRCIQETIARAQTLNDMVTEALQYGNGGTLSCETSMQNKRDKLKYSYQQTPQGSRGVHGIAIHAPCGTNGPRNQHGRTLHQTRIDDSCQQNLLLTEEASDNTSMEQQVQNKNQKGILGDAYKLLRLGGQRIPNFEEAGIQIETSREASNESTEETKSHKQHMETVSVDSSNSGGARIEILLDKNKQPSTRYHTTNRNPVLRGEDVVWINRFAEMKEFYHQNGNFVIDRRTCPDNLQLVRWVSNTREQYRRYLWNKTTSQITPPRAALLKNIGFL